MVRFHIFMVLSNNFVIVLPGINGMVGCGHLLSGYDNKLCLDNDENSHCLCVK